MKSALLMASALEFLSPTEFILQLQAAKCNASASDPHLQASWFELLARCAIKNGIELALWPCSNSHDSFLALQRHKNHPRVEGLANFYTPLFGLIGESLADSAAIVGFARATRKASNPVSEIRLTPMDPHGRSWHLLQAGLRSAGWLVGDYFCFGNWFHRVQPGGYATYLAQRPGRLRNTLRSHQKKLKALDGFAVQIYRGDESDFEGALAAFNEVYAQSWKEPEPFPKFISGLCRLAAEQGGLRLGVIRVGDQAIAAQLWWVANAWAHIVKLAYVPEYAEYSPGTVLSAALFEQVIDIDCVEGIDYLIGDDPYKADWMTERRERRGLVAFNPRQFIGLLSAGRHFGGQFLKRARRSQPVLKVPS